MTLHCAPTFKLTKFCSATRALTATHSPTTLPYNVALRLKVPTSCSSVARRRSERNLCARRGRYMLIFELQSAPGEQNSPLPVERMPPPPPKS